MRTRTHLIALAFAAAVTAACGGAEEAPDRRSRAHDGEVVARHTLGVHHLGVEVSRKRQRSRCVSRQVRETALRLLQHVAAAVGPALAPRHTVVVTHEIEQGHFVGGLEWRLAEERGVDDPECRRERGDADRERRDDREAEPARAREGPSP